MKIYKPIHLIQSVSLGKVNEISKLFSDYEDTPIQNDSKFDLAFIRYSPDTYFSNGKQIGELFQSGIFDPLVMTNYKFLALLLVCSSNPLVIFSDFSFKNDDENVESEENRTLIKDLIDNDKKIDRSFEFLKDIDQRISRIEFTMDNFKNKVVFYSNGNIGLSDNFSQIYYKEVLNLVEFLFTGSLPNER